MISWNYEVNSSASIHRTTQHLQINWRESILTMYSELINHCIRIKQHAHDALGSMQLRSHMSVCPTSLFLDPADLESSLNMARDLSWFTKSLSDLQHRSRHHKFLQKDSSLTCTPNCCCDWKASWSWCFEYTSHNIVFLDFLNKIFIWKVLRLNGIGLGLCSICAAPGERISLEVRMYFETLLNQIWYT